MNSPSSIIQAANVELFLNGALDAIPRFFQPAYRVHLTGQEMVADHDAVGQVISLYRRAFSEMKIDLRILVEADDRVAWERSFQATHSGPFKGFPASQRVVEWRDMVVSRFEDGLIAEEWVVTDLAERLLLARKK